MLRSRISLVLLVPLTAACSVGSSSATPELATAPTAAATNSPAPAEPTVVPTARASPTPLPVTASTTAPSGPFRPVLSEPQLPPDLISILYASEDGGLWLQTQQEILILREGDWTTALSDIPGELVGVDQEGLLWMIDAGGDSISSWDGATWSSYAQDSGWAPLGENSFARQPPVIDQWGQTWIVTTEDLRRFDGQGWMRFSPADLGFTHPLEEDEGVLPELHLEFLERSQELWLGSCNWSGAGPIGGQGVRRLDGGAWQEISPALSSGCTEAIAEDGEGRIWFGVGGDVWRHDPLTGEQVRFAAPPSPFEGGGSFGWVGELVLEAGNTPWADLGLCGGGGCGFGIILYRLVRGEWIEISEQGFTPHAVVFTPSGEPWLLTPGGGMKIVDNQPTELVELPIVPESVVTDRAGNAWFLVSREGRREIWTLPSTP